MEKTPVLISKIHPDAKIPEAQNVSTGYDLVATEAPEIVGLEEFPFSGLWRRIDYIQYKTGLKIAPPKGFYTLIFPRSSISKYSLVLANSVGVIDNDYRGELILRFKYIPQPDDKQESWLTVNNNRIYQKGDKIGQLVLSPLLQIAFEEVSSLDNTERGEGGFGSTGR